jgi:hypothetical protein
LSGTLKVAILTRPDDRSPRVLAESLQAQLNHLGVEADIHFGISALTRLLGWRVRKRTMRFHFWARQQLAYLLSDYLLFKKLRTYDAIVISECIPNGFWSDLYDIEALKKITGKPVLFYEVFYLGNAQSQISKLELGRHRLIDRYDWHLSVAPTTEAMTASRGPWTCIGIDLSYLKLKPQPKRQFTALVDFDHPGYRVYRENHLRILAELGIEAITLDGNYSIQEIRKLYRRAAVFFLETPEAFGLPIAECLALGTRVYLPEAKWAMSWRRPSSTDQDAHRDLPSAFATYDSWDDLKRKLANERDTYDSVSTPNEVFQSFISNYPEYYFGNRDALQDVVDRIRCDNFETES